MNFLEAVVDDPRIGTSHISMYVNLWRLWIKAGMKEPIAIKRHQMTAVCKISGFTTFHKTIRELSEYGYIGYGPSFNRLLGSRVYFTKNGIEECRQMLRLM